MSQHVMIHPDDVPLCPKCGWPAIVFMLERVPFPDRPNYNPDAPVRIMFECKQGHTFRYEDARSVGI